MKERVSDRGREGGREREREGERWTVKENSGWVDRETQKDLFVICRQGGRAGGQREECGRLNVGGMREGEKEGTRGLETEFRM